MKTVLTVVWPICKVEPGSGNCYCSVQASVRSVIDTAVQVSALASLSFFQLCHHLWLGSTTQCPLYCGVFYTFFLKYTLLRERTLNLLHPFLSYDFQSKVTYSSESLACNLTKFSTNDTMLMITGSR